MVIVTTFGDHAQIRTPALARIFLPFVDEADPTRTITWGALRDHAPVELTGGVSWVDYLGWGRGDGSFPTIWRPSMGRASDTTIDRIIQLLNRLTGEADRWVFQPFPEISALPDSPPPGSRIELDSFAALWKDRPLPGTLRAGSVSMSAPAYADSVIVAGPARLVDVGSALGLEIEAVARRRLLPVMVW